MKNPLWRVIGDGGRVPRCMGIAYRSYRFRAVPCRIICILMPFNLIVKCARVVYLWLSFLPDTRMESKVLSEYLRYCNRNGGIELGLTEGRRVER
jgi:hypothetical protein